MSSRSLESLYVELLKNSLCFMLWPEPPTPLAAFNYARPPHKRVPLSLVSSVLSRLNLELVKRSGASQADRENGRIWPGSADTMIGLTRMNNLQHCVETVIKEGIPGDLIETGVWRGGACIFMRGILAAHDVRDRRVFVADSFEGLPKPDAARFPADADDTFYQHAFLAVSQEEVEKNFARYGLLDDQVVFLKGWFKDTLPKAPIKRLAVLRLDGDMYESTMDALKNLYHKLSSGGFCIIDDYYLENCRKAVQDFRASNGIVEPIQNIDRMGAFWRKA